MIICPVGVEWFQAGGRTNGRTDMTKLIVVFRNLTNAPEKENWLNLHKPHVHYVCVYIYIYIYRAHE